MRLYLKYFSIHLKCQMQYKVTFIFNFIGRILMSFATVAGVLFMFTRFNEVDGFTLSQTLLCTSVVTMAFSIAEVFARGFDIFPRLLGNGEFDRILVRPRGIIFQVLASHIEFLRLGIFIQALAVLCYAVPNSGVIWTLDKVITLLLMIICGAAVFFGLYIVYASFAFFTTEGVRIYEHLNIWRSRIWTLSLCNLWQQHLKIFDICRTAGTDSVLSAAVSAKQRAKYTLYVYTAVRFVIYHTMLRVFPYRTTAVQVNRLVIN